MLQASEQHVPDGDESSANSSRLVKADGRVVARVVFVCLCVCVFVCFCVCACAFRASARARLSARPAGTGRRARSATRTSRHREEGDRPTEEIVGVQLKGVNEQAPRDSASWYMPSVGGERPMAKPRAA